VIERLRQQWPDLSITIQRIRTRGDRDSDVPLAQAGRDGIFVTEIEEALQRGDIDIAVHSLKDLPTAQPEGLRLVVIGPREDARDVLIARKTIIGSEPRGHPTAQRIGTCSLRRMAQILALHPGVEILPLRGNVDTRLSKLDTGDYDAIVLAAAGLLRLGLHESLTDRLTYLPIERMMPAPGQGALALEIRDEAAIQALVAPLSDPRTQATTLAERMFMRRLGAGCLLPVAAYGEIVGEELTLMGLVISMDGQRQVRVQQRIVWTIQTSLSDVEQLGMRLAERALDLGADDIIGQYASREGEHQHV
jgi:hydroxymethylbilane synthase